jgi:uncharacterized membrane protein
VPGTFWEVHMRKTLLMALAAAAFTVVTPNLASAAPAMSGGAIKAAAETASGVETVHYYGYRSYGYYYPRYYRHHHYRHFYRYY